MKTINKFITQPKGSGNIALNFQISNNNILNEMIINANKYKQLADRRLQNIK